MNARANTFECLCLLAARERWCWNLCCTTCGHMVFRWALKAIAEGRHPDDPTWSVHWGDFETSKTLAAANGPLPSPGNWPLPTQYALQQAVRGIELSNIIATVPFPDWLGYLGILLGYTEHAERDNLSLTNELAPQLLAVVERGSAAESMLRVCIERPSPIRWKDLELVERHYCSGRAPRSKIRDNA